MARILTRIVCYDIVGQRNRRRLAGYLQKKGYRLSESVFAVRMPDYQFTGWLGKLAAFKKHKDDIIDVLPLCGNCRHGAKRMGQPPDPVIVLWENDTQTSHNNPEKST